MDAKVLNELERQRAEHEEKLARAAGWFPAEPRVAGTLAELSIGIIAAAVLWILRWIATTRTVAITLGRGEARVALGPGVAGDGVSIGAGGAAASWASGGAGGGVYQTGPQSFVSTHQGGAGGSGGGVGGAGAYDERAAMLRELRALQEKVKAYQQATAPYVAEASDVEPVHLEALLRRMWMAAPTAAPEAPDKSPILASAQKALDEATAALTGADRYPGADAAERVGAAVSALGDLRTALDELEKAPASRRASVDARKR